MAAIEVKHIINSGAHTCGFSLVCIPPPLKCVCHYGCYTSNDIVFFTPQEAGITEPRVGVCSGDSLNERRGESGHTQAGVMLCRTTEKKSTLQ